MSDCGLVGEVGLLSSAVFSPEDDGFGEVGHLLFLEPLVMPLLLSSSSLEISRSALLRRPRSRSRRRELYSPPPLEVVPWDPPFGSGRSADTTLLLVRGSSANLAVWARRVVYPSNHQSSNKNSIKMHADCEHAEGVMRVIWCTVIGTTYAHLREGKT